MAGEKDPAYSIVEYMSDNSGYKCGYCKSKDTNFSHGMWAHRMAVTDYQDLIDRGWRRSGKYCYKPTMNRICCPQYTIRCDAINFQLSKSQKKVLKKMQRFLKHGENKNTIEDKEMNTDSITPPVEMDGNAGYIQPKLETKYDLSTVDLLGKLSGEELGTEDSNINKATCSDESHQESLVMPFLAEMYSKPTLDNKFKKKTKDGTTAAKISGPDPNRPPCRKAKDIRRERRTFKLAAKLHDGKSKVPTPMELERARTPNISKTLEDFFNVPHQETDAHRLELRLLRVNTRDEAFSTSFNASYEVYRKYQLAVHLDTEHECDRRSFQSFLVDSPLVPWYPSCGSRQGYGSFHQQYWLDNRLIAVGVLDILPHLVSSVYLFYDPEFSHLSLGTYASLRELSLVRELEQTNPLLRWYYMGFYIHSCPKMRYKGNNRPSFLLCPETHLWEPIEKCLPKLANDKYSRLHDDFDASEEAADLNKVLVLYDQRPVTYDTYRLLCSEAEDENEVKEYATLVGAKCSRSLLLYRSSDD